MSDTVPEAGRWRGRGLAGRCGRFLADAAAITLVAAAFNLFDPFGLATATKEYTARVFLQLASPRYEARARDDITVVLLTDHDLEILGETWPVGFDVHEEVLARILARKPKSVMVDIGFLDDRDDPSIEDFIETIAPPPPTDRAAIYLAAADMARESPLPDGILPELAEVAAAEEHVSLVAVTRTDRGRYALSYPLSGGPLDRHTAGVALYLDVLRPAYRWRVHDPVAVEAARELVREVVFDCLAAERHNGDRRARLLDQPCPEVRDPPTFEIEWYSMSGVRVNGDFENDTIMHCEPDLPETDFGRLWRLIAVNMGLTYGKSGTRALLNSCPPHRTISVVEFFRYDNEAAPSVDEQTAAEEGNACGRSGVTHDDSGKPCPLVDHRSARRIAEKFFPSRPGHLLDHIIGGKHVFYGAHVAMAADLIDPPTHTALPGVYLHTMALDNLITHAGQVPFTEPIETVGLKAFALSQVNVTVSFLVVLIHVAFVHGYLLLRPTGPVLPDGAMSVADFHAAIIWRVLTKIIRIGIFVAIYISVMFAIVRFVSLSVFEDLRMPASNIAGLFAVIFSLELFKYRNFMDEAVKWLGVYLHGYQVSRARQRERRSRDESSVTTETRGEEPI